MPLEILILREIFLGRFLGKKITCPDLAVGMWIGAAHGGTFVLKDLNPTVAQTEIRGLFLPGTDHTDDFSLRHLG